MRSEDENTLSNYLDEGSFWTTFIEVVFCGYWYNKNEIDIAFLEESNSFKRYRYFFVI